MKDPLNESSNESSSESLTASLDESLKESWKEFFKGIEEFNQQEFFQCHETLEKVWMEQTTAERELTQGIIQVAVGYYHYLRGNRIGALKLLRRGVDRIDMFSPSRLGLNLSKLVEAVHSNLAAIGDAADQELAADNPIDIPRIEFA